jgi:hypothetical protein
MIMSTTNRHPERNVRENPLSRRESEPNAVPHTTKTVHNNAGHHARVLKDLEQTTKIGRRYSFDDNGGGYQGL